MRVRFMDVQIEYFQWSDRLSRQPLFMKYNYFANILFQGVTNYLKNLEFL